MTPLNVLLLCAGNSARPILAGASMAREGAGHVRAFPAGPQPKEKPHAMALDLLRRTGRMPDPRISAFAALPPDALNAAPPRRRLRWIGDDRAGQPDGAA